MAYYARKEYSKAEIDLKQAISMDAMNVDAFYSLGMVLKAQGQKNEAVNAFGKVIEFLDKAGAGTPEKGSNPGKDILRRLALGHVNELTTGDWNLEKEIWQHTS
jgi:tetratricopeptide (TPR) repeat protein